MSLLHNRLVQFVIVGALLYALAPTRASGDLRVTAGQRDALERAEARRLGVERLSAEQRAEVLARLIDDELLLREGLRLGLDRDDAVVRARVIQRVLFHAEDAAGAAAPITDAELAAAWTADATRCRAPATLDWEHVFVAGSGDAALERARALLSRLRSEPGADPGSMGDAFALPRKMLAVTSRDVAERYGEEIASATLTLPLSAWSEPLASQYGVHLVRVHRRALGERRPLSACATELRAALAAERRRRAIAALLTRLRGEAHIEIEGSAGPVPSSSAEQLAMKELP